MNFFTTGLKVARKNPEPRTEPEHRRGSVREGGMEGKEEGGKERRRWRKQPGKWCLTSRSVLSAVNVTLMLMLKVSHICNLTFSTSHV